ncbi:hypothetical protein [Pseudomonas retamae]|uniref:Big-1 domain-containing protein n=1 Tax=Pseudomonas retamae TaxID=702110 RepID=A0ABW7DI51_9PSED
MNEPVIKAGESLVRNGDFEQGFSHWKKGSTNPSWLGIARENWNEEDVRFLKAGNRSSVSQTLTIPKSPDTGVTYELGFDCEMRHTSPGRLVVSLEDQPDVSLEIELQPSARRDSLEDQARLKNGQPLEFRPKRYDAVLDMAFEAGDNLVVSVFSPPNDSGDDISAVCITGIDLQLRLPAVDLDAIKLDSETLPPNRTLYLCPGATEAANTADPVIMPHELTFLPADGSPWQGTEAALSIVGNPLGAIVATPQWETNQPLASAWSLRCPWLDGDEYTFQLVLRNRYKAPDCSINVSLGHHRLKFRDLLEPGYYPLIDQSVRLGGQVSSYYTGFPVAGRTVKWSVVGHEDLGETITDEQGRVHWDYQATQAGTFVVQATVESLYYASGSVTQSFDITVLAADPWPTLKYMDNSEERHWTDNGYPNRGSTHVLQVILPSDSPLREALFSLHWSGDEPDRIGVAVSPALTQPVPVNNGNLSWTLTCDDVSDGQFELELRCSKLLLPSSPKKMSLARNKVRVGDVREADKSPVIEDRESALVRLQVVHRADASDSADGDPVIDALVDWETPNGIVSTRTGSGGWASVLFTPKQAGTNTIAARIRAHDEDTPIEHSFTVTAIERSSWKNQVSITLDGSEDTRPGNGLVCKRGSTHVLKITPREGSTLIGKAITLSWRGVDRNIGLSISDLDVPRTLDAVEGLSWTLSSEFATSLSSMFELRLINEALEDRDLYGRLMSPDIHDEFTVVMDRMSVDKGQVLYPCLGAMHRYTFRTHALSPLVGIDMDLRWDGSSAGELGIELCPRPGSLNVIDDSGFTWTLDCCNSVASGTFRLAFVTPYGTAAYNAMHLGHNKVNIEALHESAVTPVVGQEPAWMWAKVRSHYTGRAVDRFPVQWSVAGKPVVYDTGANGWSGFPFEPTEAGEQTVDVSITSPYDGHTQSHSLAVSSLSSDPWAGVTIKFDTGAPQLWGEHTFFPRRKGNHRIEVKAAQNSPLFNQKMTLGMRGAGPAAFDLRFNPPALGVPAVFSEAGCFYDFSVGDLTDGSFELCLASERLARLSPANAMSVGSGSHAVKISERSRAGQSLLWGETLFEHITVISSISGEPMEGIKVIWRSADLGEVTTITDHYGVASVRFLPKTPGEFELTATVGDSLYWESLVLSCTMSEPREIFDLWEPSDSEDYAHAKVVSALTGVPLAGVEVEWEYENQFLKKSLTAEDGIARLSLKAIARSHGMLFATVKGGIAGWDVASLAYGGNMPAIQSLDCERSSIYLGDEVNAWVTVIDLSQNSAMPGITIKWSFGGEPLPDAETDQEGVARTKFKPAVQSMGGVDLVATAQFGHPKEKQQRIIVNPLHDGLLKDIRTEPEIVYMNRAVRLKVYAYAKTSTWEVPLEGIKVQWSVDRTGIGYSYSNEQGWAEIDYVSGAPGHYSLEVTTTNRDGPVKLGTDLLVKWPQ